MVSGASCDSMKNIISCNRKKLSSCSNVPEKAKTDADSKIPIIVPTDKGKFYFAKLQKRIPYYNGQLNASNMRILNQRYSFFLPVQSISFYILFYHNFVRVCQIFDNSTNNSLGSFLCYDVS